MKPSAIKKDDKDKKIDPKKPTSNLTATTTTKPTTGVKKNV